MLEELVRAARRSREKLEELPLAGGLLRRSYERRVRSGPQGWKFWGSFQTYGDAMDAARHLSAGYADAGYEGAAIAEKGRDIYERMALHDYPALWWIARTVREIVASRPEAPPRVVSFGGHLAEKFRVFRRIWGPYSIGSWTVVETPAVVEVASRLPPEDVVPELRFTADRAAIDGCDIFFAAGSLQYLATSLTELLDGARQPPRTLVLNKVPLSDGPGFWTVQNAWVALVPYHVMNRHDFVQGLLDRGYRVLDEWPVPEFSVTVPFHRRTGTSANSGLCLSR